MNDATIVRKGFGRVRESLDDPAAIGLLDDLEAVCLDAIEALNTVRANIGEFIVAPDDNYSRKV